MLIYLFHVFLVPSMGAGAGRTCRQAASKYLNNSGVKINRKGWEAGGIFKTACKMLGKKKTWWAAAGICLGGKRNIYESSMKGENNEEENKK